jgi:2-polyprenyl-3-methyl-5-hydroxy-6-metoxy-1,4-benzoquinol methylase
MDTRAFPLPVMRRVLWFLDFTSRWFGGDRVILRHFDDWSRRWPNDRAVTILDVGAGSGAMACRLASWAEKRRLSIRVTCIELVDDIVSIARERTRAFPNIAVERRDFNELAERGERFDYVIASLFLHHTPPKEAAPVLRRFSALARRGIVISDLLRSRASLAAVTAASYVFGNRVVRNDGPLSVRRSFRVSELDDLAREAGLDFTRARREPWFRVSVAGEKP